jgi:hypothetical protein
MSCISFQSSVAASSSSRGLSGWEPQCPGCTRRERREASASTHKLHLLLPRNRLNHEPLLTKRHPSSHLQLPKQWSPPCLACWGACLPGHSTRGLAAGRAAWARAAGRGTGAARALRPGCHQELARRPSRDSSCRRRKAGRQCRQDEPFDHKPRCKFNTCLYCGMDRRTGKRVDPMSPRSCRSGGALAASTCGAKPQKARPRES